MASIWTALGPLDPAVLGRTLMHEHVLCDFYRVTGLLNQLLNDEFLAIGELELLVQAGGSGAGRLHHNRPGTRREGAAPHLTAERGPHRRSGPGGTESCSTRPRSIAHSSLT